MNAAPNLRLLQLNDVRLVGRLTRDPEVRYTPRGQAVCRLDIAVNRRFKDASGEWREEATFVPVTVWREAAERCRERLKKGSAIYVEGRLKSSSWETKDGQKRSGLDVEAYRLQFLTKMATEESGGGGEATEGAGEPEAGVSPEPAGVVAEPKSSRGEDEIPF
jgi:single-strand DNA-binding protein